MCPVILVLAAATLLCGCGLRLSLITAAVLVWVPAAVATAVIVTVTRPPGRSVPTVHLRGGPGWQRRCAEWIETTLTGSDGASVNLTPAAGSGPRLVTAIVYLSGCPTRRRSSSST